MALAQICLDINYLISNLVLDDVQKEFTFSIYGKHKNQLIR
jgi:hypothetical protein